MFTKFLQTILYAFLKFLNQYGHRLVAIIAVGAVYSGVLLTKALDHWGQQFWEVLPDQLENQLEPFTAVLENVNYWFPLGELLGLLVAYWLFVAAFATFKIAWQLLVPTLG